MNIGQAAKISGINAKMIRHYEETGVIPKAKRASSGYRTYTESDINILHFVKRARGLGFSMKEVKKLVSLWRNKSRASAKVKSVALEHIAHMESKIVQLQSMVKTLKHLVNNCNGDDRPDCPILDELGKN